jgi:hypothetical protein
MEQWTLIYLNGKKTHYSVSNWGNVKDPNNRLVRPKIVTINQVDNYYCSIAMGAKPDLVPVDMLVAKAFLMNPTRLHAVNHLDGNSLNNNVENLRWI